MKPKRWHAIIVVLSLLVVGTRPALGTKYIPSDLDIGTWDEINRIYMLTTDVSEAIQIDEGSLTLDGAGHSITGPGLGNGVYLNDKTGVRIQNLSVSGFAGGIRLNSSSSNTLEGNTISDNNVGIYLTYSSDGNVIVGNAVNSNSAYGIRVLSSSSNNLTDNTVNSNWHAGIYLVSSCDSTLSGNTTDSNVGRGISLEDSSNNNVLSDNAARYNHEGIRLGFSSNGNVLTDNTTESNSYGGIRLYNSSNGNTLTNNTADSCGHIAINLGYCSNNTLTGNTASNSPTGIGISQSNNNTLTGNTANSNSMFGIMLQGSGNNTLTGNIASNNYGYYGYGVWLVGEGTNNNIFTGNTFSNNNSGFEIHYSTIANILTGNTFSNNSGYGVRIASSSAVDNEVYNNNFIDNGTQATVYQATGSVFSQPLPVGGNYWSDHIGPDENGDGIVDVPYVFTGGQDDLPWIAENGWLPGWSPAGDDVIVEPLDETTGETLATLSFDNITEAGMTTLTSTTPSENQGPPQGFRFGAPPVLLDLETTATFTGKVEICFDYSGMSFGNESTLKLFHSSDGSNWVDVTTHLDTDNDIICGVVTSFSFFGVFETADPVVLLIELTQQVATLNLQQGIDNSLDAKLDAALSALGDVNANNNVAAVNTLQAFINAVEAQRGNKIPEADADDLIAAANEIITLLSEL